MALKRVHYTHLTFTDRGIIRRMLKQKCSHREIARVLGVSRTTVWRELKRNRSSPVLYWEVHANARMRDRRKAAKAKSLIIENDLGMQDYVEDLFKRHLSPD